MQKQQPDPAGLAIEKIARWGSLAAALLFAAGFVVAAVLSVTNNWDVPRAQQLLVCAGSAALALFAVGKFRKPFKWTPMPPEQDEGR